MDLFSQLPAFLRHGVDYSPVQSPMQGRVGQRSRASESNVGSPVQAFSFSDVTCPDSGETDTDMERRAIVPIDFLSTKKPVLLFDLRQNHNIVVRGKIVYIQLRQDGYKSSVAVQYHLPEDKIFIERQEMGPPIVVLRPEDLSSLTIVLVRNAESDLENEDSSDSDKDEEYLRLSWLSLESSVKDTRRPKCLAISSAANTAVLKEKLIPAGKRNSYELIVEHRKLQDTVIVSDVLNKFSVLHVSKVKPLLVKAMFLKRHNTSFTFKVKVSSVDTGVYLTQEIIKLLNENGIFLDPETSLVLTVNTHIVDDRCLEIFESLFIFDNMQQTKIVTSYIHFVHPNDVKLYVEPLHKRKRMAGVPRKKQSKAIVFVSLDSQTSVLREEVAKVVGVEPEALQLYVGNDKIPEVSHLQDVGFLKAGCSISCRQRDKVKLRVRVLYQDTADVREITLDVNKLDSITTIVAKLVGVLHVPRNTLSLKCGAESDRETVKDLNLHQKSHLEVTVYPKRVYMNLWIQKTRQKRTLLIDNPDVISVFDILSFIAYKENICFQQLRLVHDNVCHQAVRKLAALNVSHRSLLLIICVDQATSTTRCASPIMLIESMAPPGEHHKRSAFKHEGRLYITTDVVDSHDTDECACDKMVPVGIQYLSQRLKDDSLTDSKRRVTETEVRAISAGQRVVDAVDSGGHSAAVEFGNDGSHTADDVDVLNDGNHSAAAESRGGVTARKSHSSVIHSSGAADRDLRENRATAEKGFSSDSQLNDRKKIFLKKAVKLRKSLERVPVSSTDRLESSSQQVSDTPPMVSGIVAPISTSTMDSQKSSWTSYYSETDEIIAKTASVHILTKDKKLVERQYTEKVLDLAASGTLPQQCQADATSHLRQLAVCNTVVETEIKRNGFSRKLLTNIAKGVGKAWMMLGRDLKVPEHTLDDIQREINMSLDEKCFKMLLAWYNNAGSSATRQALADALIDNGLKLVAEDHLPLEDGLT